MHYSQVDFRAADDTRLTMHRWLPRVPVALAFYIHGIQSHSGWLFDTGPALATRGIAVVSLDRRGSGKSDGQRGDVSSYRVWLHDYAEAYRATADEYTGMPRAIVGWSMGGSLVAGLLAIGLKPTPDCAVFSAPGLAQHFYRLSPEQRTQRHGDRREEPILSLPIKNEQYTKNPEFLEFIAADSRMLTQVSPRFKAEQLAMDEMYLGKAPLPDMPPSVLMLPREDEIAEQSCSLRAFDELTGGRGLVLQTWADAHLLEFSNWRQSYWSFVECFVTTRGFRAAPP